MIKGIVLNPQFDKDMEVIGVSIECEDKSVLDSLDIDELQEQINTDFNDEYGVCIAVTKAKFEELQDNGKVEIAVNVEEQSVDIGSGDFDLGGNNSIGNGEKGSDFIRDKRSYNSKTKLNKQGYEVIMPYLERDYVISEAIITRGMSSYKSVLWLDDDGDTVWTKNKCLTPIEIKLLDKISNDISYDSTGMDTQTVVSMMKQEKGSAVFLKLEFYFPDGNVIGKYKLIKAQEFENKYIDISF